MVTVNTSNDELLSIIKDEQMKAVYWLNRKTSDKQYYEIEKTLKTECRKTGVPQTSELVKYEAQSGNTWYAYFRAFPEGNSIFVASYAFLCKKTKDGFVVYMPMDSDGNCTDKRVLIFPPHFFDRIKDRLGVEVSDEDVIKRFLGMVQTMAINEKGDSDKRKAEVEMVFSGAVWRGVYRNEDKRVVVASTFITKLTLSKRDKRVADKFERIQSKVVQHKEHTTRKRIENGEGGQIIKELAANVFAFQASSGDLENYFAMCAVMVKKVGDYMGMTFTFDDVLKIWIDDSSNPNGVARTFFELAFVLKDSMKETQKMLNIVGMTLMFLGCNKPMNEVNYCVRVALADFSDTWVEMTEDRFFTVKRKDFRV